MVRSFAREIMRAASLLAIFVILDGATAHATECGELRAEQARLKTALAFDRSPLAADGKKALAAIERKLPAACAPRKVSIAALPIAYLAVPPGNLSKASLELGDGWGLTLTTQAGAAHGIVFADPVTLDVPRPLKWDSELSPNKTGVELFVAVAIDAQLTVEEPATGRGTWRIDLKGKPELVAMSKIRACAGGKPEAGKLSKESCQLLARIDPMPKHGAVPERGRAQLAGEWQYGWHSTAELADEELSVLADAPLPARLDLHLDLSAPLPGISDGKKLAVTFEGRGAATTRRRARSSASPSRCGGIVCSACPTCAWRRRARPASSRARSRTGWRGRWRGSACSAARARGARSRSPTTTATTASRASAPARPAWCRWGATRPTSPRVTRNER
jgi:hypothetical protein